jgi:hypothetical protein
MEKEEDEAAEEEKAEAESSIQVVSVFSYDFVLLSLLRIRHAYSLLRLAILY